jgi:hypothetical protein
MSSLFLRAAYLFLAGLVLGTAAQAGITEFTDPGKTDFDTALQILNPYGTWAKSDGVWAYTPTDHFAPYTDGRWIYTEYGWYWKGNRPYSWATDHYGFWKRGADKVWAWYPGPYWLSQAVEIRASSSAIGWRSAAVDEEGNFLEAPIDRYTKPDEWAFVTRAQFANPITPSVLAKPDEAKRQLDVSTESRHSYLTYREIDRPGPHPADFVALSKDGGMFAPKTLEDLAPQPPALTNGAALATNNAAHTVAATQPALADQDGDDDADDRRQVHYWVTMSLPTFWTPKPPDAKPGELYIYRPDFYQDQDGIERRITYWFNPHARVTLKDALGSTAGPATRAADPSPESSPAAARPATPAEEATSDAFRSPLDFPERSNSPHATPSASSKNPAPSGKADANPPATNGATNN